MYLARFATRLGRLLAAALLTLGPASDTAADPGYYLLVPYDNAGVRVFELRYWSTHRGGAPSVVWPELGFGWGVNSRWTSTLFASWIGSRDDATHLSSLNWQNSVLLTQGEWPLDVALHLQLIRSHAETGESNPRALELGVLLQTHEGRTQLNANLVFERRLGYARNNGTNLKLQWQARHPLRPGLAAGVQGFGELGPWDDWSTRQSHRAGPALFASWRFEDGPVLKLQAAWLIGRTFGRHGRMFSARAAFEF